MQSSSNPLSSLLRLSSSDVSILSLTSTLDEILELLPRANHGTVVVVSENGEMAGTLTMGDLLKFSIENGALPKNAREAMNPSPTTVGADSDFDQFGFSDSLRLVPILGRSGNLEGAWVRRKGILNSQTLPVLIVAGGRGARLRPATDSLPKPLLPVGGIPILERLIRSLTLAGFFKIYISVAYLAEKIIEYFGDGSRFNCEITYLHEDQPLGTAGSLALLPETVENVLLSNADLLTDTDFLQFVEAHRSSNAAATLLTREVTVKSEYGVVNTNSLGQILGLEEKPSFTQIINGGVYLLDLSELRQHLPIGEFSATDVIEIALTKGLKVMSWLSSDMWLDLGRPSDLERANKAFELTRGQKGE